MVVALCSLVAYFDLTSVMDTLFLTLSLTLTLSYSETHVSLTLWKLISHKMLRPNKFYQIKEWMLESIRDRVFISFIFSFCICAYCSASGRGLEIF